MFESVGRMFRSNKSDDEATSSPKKSRFKEDGSVSNQKDNSHELKVDDSSIILQRITQLHLEQLMTDVTLVVQNKEFPAHRLILCTSSDVFQVMLMRPEWSEWRESRIILQEPQQCVPVFHLFLRYFYSGQITLTHDNVMPILALADKYNVKNLTHMCGVYMCSNIAYAAAHNQLISWLQYTIACGHTQIAKNCQNFVKWNLETISKTDDFGNFETDIFITILQQNDLVIENEMALYSCAVKWLEHQSEHWQQDGVSQETIDEHIKSLTEQVMMHIRFPMMSPRQLAELLLSPLINKFKEFFVERMAIGMIYHSGQEDRVQELCSSETGRLLFTPRLYTADQFSSVLTIDNFHSLPSYDTRAYIFPTQLNLAEYMGEYFCDWVVELYPKGVWFRKYYLIVWQGTVEVPAYVIPTVRLSVACKDTLHHRVKISILVFGEKAGIEHVVHVVQQIHTFSDDDKLINIDDVIPFEDINPRITNDNSSSTNLSSNQYFIGSNNSTLKMHIIITPITEFCSNNVPNLIFK